MEHYSPLKAIFPRTVSAAEYPLTSDSIIAIVLLCRVPKGTVDAALSYCHDNLADDTLQGLVPYLREKGVKVVSASFSSMGLLTQKASGPDTLSHVQPSQIMPPRVAQWSGLRLAMLVQVS